jgi:diguanylate cyclase (GGDEF)-like protein
MSAKVTKPSGVYLVVVTIWLLLVAVVMSGIIAFDLQRAEKVFLDNVNALYRQVGERLRINESVLEGFAAMVSATTDLDRRRIRVYAKQMLNQYPHIYMFQIVEKVPRNDVESFVENYRRSVHPAFEIKAFSYESDRQWKPAEEKPVYLPIIFMEPFPAGSRRVLGLDLSANESLVRALHRSESGNQAAISIPFRTVEGDLAYLINRPVPKPQLPDGTTISDQYFKHRFVVLVIRTETLLERKALATPGMRLLLYHPEFEKTDSAGHLFFQEGPVVGRLESSLFPHFSLSRVMENASQPFELVVDQQLGWPVLSWGKLGLTLLVGMISFAVVMVYARFYHRNEVKRMEMADRLFYLANHDALTGLANRNLLNDRLDHAIVQTNRQHRQLAVLFLDLDAFKAVNDTYGHDAGDNILRNVAERLRACVRAGDTIARLGGDEFVLILENIFLQEDVGRVIEKIKNGFEQSFSLNSHSVKLGVSVGMAMYPRDGNDLETLLSYADLSMYEDKRSADGEALRAC